MSQKQNTIPKRKENNDKQEDYKRYYKDKRTGTSIIYYSKYRLDYKEHNIIKQIAFNNMQDYNKSVKYNKALTHNLNQEIAIIYKKPKEELLAAIDKHQQQQEIKQEAKIYQRMQQLEKAEEAANRYFTAVQLKKKNNLERFIKAIKEHNTKALEYFRKLTPEQQEELANKVDNYLYKLEYTEEEVLIGNQEILEKGAIQC